MAFSEQVLASRLKQEVFDEPACTESEWHYLTYTAMRLASKKPVYFQKANLTVDGKRNRITALQKLNGTNTWLITQSANPELEGLIIKDPRTRSQESKILRYFNGAVCFTQDMSANLVETLPQLGLPFPLSPYVALNNLIDILGKLDVPLGKHFAENVNDFANWIRTYKSHLADGPWPAHVQWTQP